jgi:inner membrane protein
MTAGAISSMGEWAWIGLAAVLLAVEIIAPGTFLLWLGLAAAATGAVFLLVPAGWQMQLAVYAGFSVAGLLVWSRLAARHHQTTTDRPFLNRRGDALLGQEFVLDEAIVAGRGRIRVDDSVWSVSGPDLASGSRVRVSSVDGAVLQIEPVG